MVIEKNTLLSLITQAQEIMAIITDNDGELTEESEAMMAMAGRELRDKVDGYGHVLEGFKSRQAYAMTRLKEWERVVTVCDKAIDNLKTRVSNVLDTLETPEIHGYEFTFRLQSNPPSVEVLDETKVPGDFLITETKTTTRVDKKKALEELKSGKDIPGLEIRRSTRVVSKVSQRKEIKPIPAVENV
jgi:hypothetical protein